MSRSNSCRKLQLEQRRKAKAQRKRNKRLGKRIVTPAPTPHQAMIV
jgi:hypothetical protein